MKNTGNIALVLCFLIISLIAVDRFGCSSRKKIGVLQMQELVYEYQGMKDATKKYTAKVDKWSVQADSLENKLRVIVDEIKMDSINNDRVKLKIDKQKYYLMQKSYYEYRQKTEQKAQQEDKDMTQGVINQINERINEFAKQEGYDVIISNNQMQNVSYVNESIDITREVLEFANNKYKGEE